MRARSWLFFASVSWLMTMAVATGRQTPAARSQTPRPAAAGRPQPMKPVATIQDVMIAMVNPASDVIYNAVATSVTASGVENKAPRNDHEWALVRNNALVLIEAGNLLLVDRPVASAASTAAAAALNPESPSAVELAPNEIARRIRRDRATWSKLARALIDAGLVALKAIDAKNPEALLEAGDAIEMTCEQCHERYWYPEEKK
jgi:hypothetical protein